MKQYVINEETLALEACSSDSSKIYEVNNSFICLKNVNKIVNYSCSFYGSSLQGRRMGTQALIGTTYKAPVIIEESREIIFFPIVSLRSQMNIWINLSQIEDYYKKLDKTVVLFKNNLEMEVPITYSKFDNQVMKSAKLESTLRRRKKVKKCI